MGNELIIRIIGGLLFIVGILLLYFLIIDEEKLKRENKRENDFGANIKLITGSLIAIILGLFLMISGKI